MITGTTEAEAGGTYYPARSTFDTKQFVMVLFVTAVVIIIALITRLPADKTSSKRPEA